MNSKKSKKKETATLVYKKIGGALADMTSGVKERTFDKILKKVSASLAEGIEKAAKKESAKAGKKSKPEKNSSKKSKPKKKESKSKKDDKSGAPKMNNNPVAIEAPAIVENGLA